MDVCTAYVRIMNGLMNGRLLYGLCFTYGLCTHYERVNTIFSIFSARKASLTILLTAKHLDKTVRLKTCTGYD